MKYIIIFIITATTSLKLCAQSGTLDNSFGNDGKVFSETFSAGCSAIALQADGKIIAGGNGSYDDLTGGFFVARYNSDGTLDNTFGNEGRIITILTKTGGHYMQSIACLPGGKILAAGFVGSYEAIDVALTQYKLDGSLDSSFGINGVVITDIAKFDYIYDMAIQADGKIVVAGNRKKNENDNETSFTIRYMPDGSLDNSFGEKGIVLTTYKQNIDITSIATQPDGKIVLGGIYDGSDLEFMLVRYETDGTVDLSFGLNGIALLSFKNNLADYSQLFDIAIQSDGKIIAAGDNGALDDHMVIARFTSNGAVDSSFGESKGYTSPFFEKGTSYTSEVLVQSNGKILLAGNYVDVTDRFAILRLKENGKLDSSFGENGITLTTFEDAGTITCNAIALQADDKIVLGGTSYLNTPPHYYHFILSRYDNKITESHPEFAKIKKWKGHYGFSWDDWSGNKTTYYSVGRSTNASTYTEIAQVPDVKGIKNYKYQDPAPPAGIVYYQLTAYRTDDKVVSSNVVTCGNDVPNNFIKLYPNPAKNSLQIDGLSKTGKTKLTVIDLSGNIKVSATATAGSHTLNIAALKPGNYMLRIESNGSMVTRMFVKE